jgi:N-acetylmuramoyl-L-alanine amidase
MCSSAIPVRKPATPPLGRGNLPSVLAELGYLSNSADLALLQDPAGQERLATALYSGLKNFADQRKDTRQ